MIVFTVQDDPSKLTKDAQQMFFFLALHQSDLQFVDTPALSFVVSVYVQPDHFKWKCANLLIGSGDFERSSAAAFKAAFKPADNIWAEVNYISGSHDMTKAIKGIMDTKITHQRSCMVTVVFGYAADFAGLLLAAHDQGYTGEWIVTGFIGNHVDYLVEHLTPHLKTDSAVQQFLQGM